MREAFAAGKLSLFGVATIASVIFVFSHVW
jgi:hypothetical protein